LQFLNQLKFERVSEKQNTLEGHIVKVVVQNYEKGKPLPFFNIWDKLIEDLDGCITRTIHEMNTADFGIVTKQKVGYRLRVVLGGKSRPVRTNDGVIRMYDFDFTKLQRIAKKYGYPLVTKLQSSTTIVEEGTPQESNKVREEIDEQLKDLSQRIDKLSNTVTKKRDLTNFLSTLWHLTRSSNKIPIESFSKLLKEFTILPEDLFTLSNSRIMKCSTIDQIECEKEFVAIVWPKDVKIDDFFEENG
jgi:hypothetical protein